MEPHAYMCTCVNAWPLLTNDDQHCCKKRHLTHEYGMQYSRQFELPPGHSHALQGADFTMHTPLADSRNTNTRRTSLRMLPLYRTPLLCLISTFVRTNGSDNVTLCTEHENSWCSQACNAYSWSLPLAQHLALSCSAKCSIRFWQQAIQSAAIQLVADGTYAWQAASVHKKEEHGVGCKT